jgi:hypothetical protein
MGPHDATPEGFRKLSLTTIDNIFLLNMMTKEGGKVRKSLLF